MIKPSTHYLHCKELKKETGVVTESSISDHWQKYEVLNVADPSGWWEGNLFVESKVKPGDVIYVQKHAEADTPPELKEKGEALVLASRVMSVVEEDK
jgi:co-chaperonin GroES (HSP10)